MEKRLDGWNSMSEEKGWMSPEQKAAEADLKLSLSRVVFDRQISSMYTLQKPEHQALRDEFGEKFWIWACKVPMKTSKCRNILYEIHSDADDAASGWYSSVFVRMTYRRVRSVAGWKIRIVKRRCRENSARFDRILAVTRKEGVDSGIRMMMTSAYNYCRDLKRDYQRDKQRRAEPLKDRSLEDVPFIFRTGSDQQPDRYVEEQCKMETLLKCLNKCGLNQTLALLGDALKDSRKEVADYMAKDCVGYISELLDDVSLICNLSREKCYELADKALRSAKDFSIDPDDQQARECLVDALYRQTSRNKRENLQQMHRKMFNE